MKYGKLTLKQHRQLAGLTQEELAEALDMDKTTLVTWESGRLPKTLERAIKLEKMFDIRLADDFLMPEA